MKKTQQKIKVVTWAEEDEVYIFEKIEYEEYENEKELSVFKQVIKMMGF
jgi:hypothetical protein